MVTVFSSVRALYSGVAAVLVLSLVPSLALAQSSYWQIQEYSGATFFDGFEFLATNETFGDPTHGAVNYLSAGNAWDQGLVYIGQDGLPVLRSDSWTWLPYGAKRNSVRLESKARFDGGLFIVDLAAMPTGCTNWGAVWTYGDNWPNSGEIDVVEGVNVQSVNQMVLHTKEGCYMAVPGQFTGTPGSTSCGPSSGGAGCSIRDTKARGTFGQDFNAQGGGVFAMLWDGNGIQIWSWPAGPSVPADINARNPLPFSWGTPAGAWAPYSCDPYVYFKQHRLVINIAICGDWAGDGGSYSTSGCPGSCIEQVMNPNNYLSSSFRINSIRVYTAAGLAANVAGLGRTFNASTMASPARATNASSGAATLLSTNRRRWIIAIPFLALVATFA